MATKPQPKQTSALKITLIIVGVLVTIPIVLAVYVFGGLAYRSYSLEEQAKTNATYLNNLQLLTGQKTQATARPNGDALTGSSAPATARFTASGKLSDSYVDIARNLGTAGYTVEPEFRSNDTAGNSLVSTVTIRALKDSKNIVVRFHLNTTIQCDLKSNDKTPCYYPKGTRLENTMLYTQTIKEIVVTYDPTEDPSYIF